MASLPPPHPRSANGIVLNGTILTFDPKTIELLLGVNAACTATLVARKNMDDATFAGEDDLLPFAQTYRIACTDEEVAFDALRDHLKKFL